MDLDPIDPAAGTAGIILGHQYIATRPCGKVSGTAWDDEMNSRESLAASVACWIARGDNVTRVERRRGDPMPEIICANPGPDCCSQAICHDSKIEQFHAVALEFDRMMAASRSGGSRHRPAFFGTDDDRTIGEVDQFIKGANSVIDEVGRG